ncbi:MAG TPA: hypothetical protein VGB85_19365, partial [Nannocystis sp.]
DKADPWIGCAEGTCTTVTIREPPRTLSGIRNSTDIDECAPEQVVDLSSEFERNNAQVGVLLRAPWADDTLGGHGDV